MNSRNGAHPCSSGPPTRRQKTAEIKTLQSQQLLTTITLCQQARSLLCVCMHARVRVRVGAIFRASVNHIRSPLLCFASGNIPPCLTMQCLSKDGVSERGRQRGARERERESERGGEREREGEKEERERESVCVCVCGCVRACVGGWVAGWMGVCVCVCVCSASLRA